MRSTKSRPYRMARRAELVDQTRERITAATARLHTSIGPANTSVAAIAEEAGVTRLTVYRHFADLDVLFEACRAHWRAENPPPDISAWTGMPNLEARARTRADPAVRLVSGPRRRALPDLPRHVDDARHLAGADAGRESPARRIARRGCRAGRAGGRRLRAAARHVLDYRTWRSFAIDQDLRDAEVVEIGVALLKTLASPKSR